MKCLKVVIGLAVTSIVVGVGLMYAGVIDVAATDPHNALTAYVLSTTMDNSVRYHAKGITPPSLNDPQMVMDGYRHYREMCSGCHLAPGMDSSDIRQGLLPMPPKLQEAVNDWNPAELFWITKNGVKMSGMPAWGLTHSDAKIWDIVAFLEKLPHMSAEQYQEMGKTSDAAEGQISEPRPDEDTASPDAGEPTG